MRYDIEASKSLAFQMKQKYKASAVPNKKKYQKKKERRNNKIKHYKEEF